jgi:hypothetical protein
MLDLEFLEGDRVAVRHPFRLDAREPDSASRKGFDFSDAIYLITPDRFANGDPGNDNVADMQEQADHASPNGRHGGDIAGISRHLDYIAGMGFTQLWPTPLLENNQLREVAFQIANCSPAIRTLQANLPTGDAGRERRAELQGMFAPGSAIILATREKDDAARKARALFPAYKQAWERIGRHYNERERSAAVYVCPMHPLDRHLEKDARCTACGMSLRKLIFMARPSR